MSEREEMPVKIESMLATIGVASLVAAALSLVSPAVGHADDDCDYNFYLNTDTGLCQFCDSDVAYWNYDTNQCLTPDADIYVGPAAGPDPVIGPVGPIGVGPDPVLGPVGPVGVGPR